MITDVFSSAPYASLMNSQTVMDGFPNTVGSTPDAFLTDATMDPVPDLIKKFLVTRQRSLKTRRLNHEFIPGLA